MSQNLDFSKIVEEIDGYAIFRLSVEGIIQTWNAGAEKIKGYTNEEILGKSFECFFTQSDKENNKPYQLLQHAITNGKSVSEGWRLRKSGNRFWASTSLTAVHDDDGNVVGLVKITRDLTESLELLQSNKQNEIFVSQAPHAMAMFDTNMCYLAASNKWLSDYGLVGKEILGQSHYTIFPEIGQEWKDKHQRCLKGEINQCAEAPFERADGSIMWLSWDVRPWYTSDDTIGGLLMYTEDLTEKINTRKYLTLQERQFRGAFISSAFGMALVSLEGKWLEVNPMLCKLFGYKENELLALTFQDITHPDDLENDLDLLKDTLSGERENYQMEKRYFHKNGSVIYATLSVSLVRDEQNEPSHFVSLIENITERKRAEFELRKLNRDLTAILDSTTVSIIATDTTGVITKFNKGAQNMLGYSAEEVVNIHTPEIIHVEEEVKERGVALSAYYKKKIEGFEVFVTKARHGEYETKEWTYKKKNGSTFPVQLAVSAIKNKKGNITGFLGIATDITALRESQIKLEDSKKDLEVLADRLTNQNEKLLEFAHITSHNLRAPVSNLVGLLDLYNKLEDKAIRQKTFEHFNTSVSVLSDTLDQLMTMLKYQQLGKANVEPVDVNEVLDKVVSTVSTAVVETGASITRDLAEVPVINFNKVYLESIFLNLVTNSLKYRAENRRPEIEIKTEKVKQKVVISVKDNGLGIDLEKHGHKLFGLYKTFHRNEDSRGVGLFITKSQVEAMGGKIYAKSTPNNGATFRIELE